MSEKSGSGDGWRPRIRAACVRELAAKGFRVGIHYRTSGAAQLPAGGDRGRISADGGSGRIDQVEAMAES